MNFDFSDDQKLLKDQARKFLTEKCTPKIVRRVLEGADGHDAALWKADRRNGLARHCHSGKLRRAWALAIWSCA